MGETRFEHARKFLAQALPENGRRVKRSDMTRTKLSKMIGRDKSYIGDFIDRKKDSLGAEDIPLIEEKLGLPSGGLLNIVNISDIHFNAGNPDGNIQRIPVDDSGEELLPAKKGVILPGNHDLFNPERYANKKLSPGEIPERNVIAGLGHGGIGDEVYIDGKVLDGIRAIWKLPVEYLRTELRARESEVDIIAVDGDSMIPTLSPGDRVIINRSQTAPSPDGLYAIFDGIGISVKRLELISGSKPIRVKVISDNPRHGSHEILVDDLNVIGRVIMRMSRL